MTGIVFGRSPTDIAWQRREYLYKVLTAMKGNQEWPTTVSSSYYVGVQDKQWPSDAEHTDKVNPKTGEKYRRTPRQDVSDAVNWLMDHNADGEEIAPVDGPAPEDTTPLISEDAIVDLSRGVIDYTEPDDPILAAYLYARRVRISPWKPGPAPLLIVESRSLMSALDGTVMAWDAWSAPLVGMSGRSLLRDVLKHPKYRIDTPVAYMGDWNDPGFDIARNAKEFLRSRGWEGSWTLLAMTDTDAAGLPQITKTDLRYKPAKRYQSVEAEALGTTALRQRLVNWYLNMLPADYKDSKHQAAIQRKRNTLMKRIDPKRFAEQQAEARRAKARAKRRQP